MKAEEFISKFRKDAIRVVDDRSENIDFRFSRYFQHVGRLETLFLTNQISQARYRDLMAEWKQHWPTSGRAL